MTRSLMNSPMNFRRETQALSRIALTKVSCQIFRRESTEEALHTHSLNSSSNGRVHNTRDVLP